MRLQIEHDLQPVFDPTEKGVVFLEDRPFRVRQTADLFEPSDGLERVSGAQLGQVAAVEELQELDDELDVADSAVSGFHVPRGRAVRNPLDPPLQRFHAADVGMAEVAAKNPGRQCIEKLASQGQLARHRSGLDVRLTLPRPAAGVVIGQGVAGVHDHRPPAPLRPQPHVYPIYAPQLGLFGQHPHQFPGDKTEELDVWNRSRSVGRPFAVAEEDQVDVARVIQFQAAELTQCQDDEPGGSAVGTPGYAALGMILPPRRLQRRLQDRVGQEGNLHGHRPKALLADDVAVGDPQSFAALEPSQRPHHDRFMLEREDFRGQFVDHRLAG